MRITDPAPVSTSSRQPIRSFRHLELHPHQLLATHTRPQRRGCHSHVVSTTWLGHPRHMPPGRRAAVLYQNCATSTPWRGVGGAMSAMSIDLAAVTGGGPE